MWNGLDAFFRDVRYALRRMRGNLLFTGSMMATLALGIGANSAIFSIVYGVLLRPLPYPEPDRIVTLQPSRLSTGLRTETADGGRYTFWRDRQKSFENMAAVRGASPANMETEQGSERVLNRPVTAGFFRVLAVVPALGRFFDSAEDRPGSAGAMVLSYGFWQRRFGGDPRVVGRNVVLGARSYTVIGVAPLKMVSTLAADLWTPLIVEQDLLARGANYVILARLKTGVTVAQGQAEMAVIGSQYIAFASGGALAKETVGVFEYGSEAVRGDRPALLVLMVAVGLVLLIACANVANLLLARAAARRREMAVRLAIGAPRAQLFRQLLTESVLLALGGAVFGLVLAKAILWAVVERQLAALPRLDEVVLDWRVLLFTLALALATGVLFGIAPAVQSLQGDLQDRLREGAGRASESRGGRRLRGALVVLEFALSLILLVGTTLLVQTFVRLRMVDTGFDPSHVLTMATTLAGNRYQTSEQVARFAEQVVGRVKAIPGVRAAALTNYLPLAGGINIPLESITGVAKKEDEILGNLEWFAVTPGFFEAMKIQMRTGRAFDGHDTAAAPPVVVVNEAFVRAHLKNRNPLGNQAVIAWRLLSPSYADAPREIVGVARDIHEGSLKTATRPSVFIPLAQVGDRVSKFANQSKAMNLVIRTSGEPLALSREAMAEIRVVDPLIPIFNIRSMEDVLADSIKGQRFLMILIGSFGALAILLAAVGIYGVMSYSVTQRTREIGIRAALGARPAELLRLILGEGMGLAAFGMAIGFVGAWMLSRLLASFLFGVTPRDAASFGSTVIVLAAVALIACTVAARQIFRIDPIGALRNE